MAWPMLGRCFVFIDAALSRRFFIPASAGSPKRSLTEPSNQICGRKISESLQGQLTAAQCGQHYGSKGPRKE